MRLSHLIALGAVILLPLGAQAQWLWVDKDNKKVFSDQAPPSDIPDSKILRRPSSVPRPAPAADAQQAATAGAPPLAPPGTSGVDKSLQEKARKAEEDEKARQKAEADKQAQAKADNCNRARQS